MPDNNESLFIAAATNMALMQMLKVSRPRKKEPIVPWLKKNVDMSFDKTAAASGHYSPYAYQVEPLEAQEDRRVHHISLMMGQRLGKSTIWRMGLLKRVADGGCSALIAYPSLDLGLKQNNDAVKPLLTMLPEVRRDFAMRGNVKVDSYHSPSTSSVVYFMGAGSPILSLTASYIIVDEVDFIELGKTGAGDKNTSQLKNLWLRGQTYSDRLMIDVSSPTNYSGAIYNVWLKGSRGIWNLRCVSCGGLVPANRLAFRRDGADRWAGLQWDKDERGQIIPDSLRYVCPLCGYEHDESEAEALAFEGKYVHEVESNIAHRSFQAGALANPRLWKWLEIAQAQEDATDADGKKYLHNTVLGMPYKHVREGDPSVSIETSNKSRQVEYPPDLAERIVLVCAGVDQQKSELAGRKYYVAVVRGWDDDGNSWLLSHGIDESLDALHARLSTTHYGHQVRLAMIDQGGFSNVDDLEPFVASHPTCYFYKGAAAKDLHGENYLASATQKKLFLCNAIGYQVKLLDLLYSPRRPRGYCWWLPMQVLPDYMQQLSNVRPNPRMTKDSNGQEYAQWAAFGGDRRDYFDAERMALCAMDIACDFFPPSSFASGHIPTFAAREKIMKILRQKKRRQ